MFIDASFEWGGGGGNGVIRVKPWGVSSYEIVAPRARPKRT